MIQAKRIYLVLFYLTCTLATGSGRDTGTHTALLLTIGICRKKGDVCMGWGVST